MRTQTTGGVVALGFFDGVHAGHLAIIGAASREAQSRGVPLGVWMPSAKAGVSLLTDEAEKLSALAAAGVTFALTSDFDSIKDLSGEEFVKRIICGELRAVCVVCGDDFRFGRGASCGSEDLKNICAAHGIGCVVADTVRMDGEAVSSSRIRTLLSEGKIDLAEELLTRPYSLTLPVVHGKKLARRLGHPTANMLLSDNFAPVAEGVYATLVTPDPARPTEKFFGVTNAARHEFGGTASDGVWLETHVMGFSGELYGEKVKIEFIKRLRGEMRFSDADSLARQIELDEKAAVPVLEEHEKRRKEKENAKD